MVRHPAQGPGKAQYVILLFVDFLHRIPLKQAECRTGLSPSRFL